VVLQICKKAVVLACSLERLDGMLAASDGDFTFPAGWDAARQWLTVELPEYMRVGLQDMCFSDAVQFPEVHA
jgi:hypothetical protein